MSRIRWMTVALVMLAATGLAAAQSGAPDVRIEVEVQREVVKTDAEGREVRVLEDVDVSRPGDVLVYTVRARNDGSGPALNARIDDPIPAGTVLLTDSVDSDGLDTVASLDRGKTFKPFPVLVRTKADDGKDALAPAPPEAYTHLRWVLDEPLAPGATRATTFKVRVL